MSYFVNLPERKEGGGTDDIFYLNLLSRKEVVHDTLNHRWLLSVVHFWLVGRLPEVLGGGGHMFPISGIFAASLNSVAVE
jgi:hypothetical protein